MYVHDLFSFLRHSTKISLRRSCSIPVTKGGGGGTFFFFFCGDFGGKKIHNFYVNECRQFKGLSTGMFIGRGTS